MINLYAGYQNTSPTSSFTRYSENEYVRLHSTRNVALTEGELVQKNSSMTGMCVATARYRLRKKPTETQENCRIQNLSTSTSSVSM